MSAAKAIISPMVMHMERQLPDRASTALEALLRGAHAGVRDLHILVQLVQQPRVQVQLLVHRQRYVLQRQRGMACLSISLLLRKSDVSAGIA